MSELDNLKPEVREALEDIDDCMRMEIKVVPVGALGVIRAELVQLAECESELAALKRRIEEAPVVTGDENGLCVAAGWNGVRVRLLLDDGESA